MYVGEGDDEPGEQQPLPDELLLPLPLPTCLELWTAYDRHGVMPVGGGYFDQPRWWRRIIRLMNSLYNPINKAHLAAMFPNRDENADDLRLYESLTGGDMRDGWDAFARE